MAHEPLTGMLLTAGLGTRLRPVTDRLAKPAVPFLNVPLLFYSFFFLRRAGCTRFVFNAHYKPEQIRTYVDLVHRQYIDAAISLEAEQPLGSGGGIKHAQRLIRGSNTNETADFFVCNGDEVILPRDPTVFEIMRSEHVRRQSLATILVMEHPLVGTQFGGVWVDDEQRVLGFGKNGMAFARARRGYHFVGAILFRGDIFQHLPDGEHNIFYDALTAAIARGERVHVVVSDFTWFETGNPHDFLNATGEALALLAQNKQESDCEFLREVLAANWIQKSELVTTPRSVLLRDANLEISSTTTIDGFAVLGHNVQLSDGTSLVNTVALHNADLRSKKQFKDEIVVA